MFLCINRFVRFVAINHNLIKTLIRNESHFHKLSNNKFNDNSERVEKHYSKNEREFIELSVETFSQLITNNSIKEKIDLILSEYEYEKYTTLRVPITLTVDNMIDLLRVRDSEERKRFFAFLYLKELAKEKSLRKKREKSQNYVERQEVKFKDSNSARTGIWSNSGDLTYGLWHNTLFTKVMKNSLNHYYGHRLRIAAMFGQKVVVDLDYDQYMNLSECRLLAKQLQLLYSYNRYESIEPFDLHFTNCNPQMPTMEAIPRHITNYKSPQFMAPFHTKSYIDLFPKEQLLYLTPNAKEPLKYSADDIYIIGGFIDKSCRDPISYIKAEREGIRTARLPIDEHVLWSGGSKHLCLNHTIAILHDMRMSGDWRKSLRDNIPQRKLKTVDDIEYEDRLRQQKLKQRFRTAVYQRKK